MPETLMAKPILTLAAEWAVFEASLGESVADAEMKALLRCAFYAGAVAVLHVQTYPGQGGGKAPTEAEMEARMTTISAEVKQFTDEMAKRRG
jgi:hypothetical protein